MQSGPQLQMDGVSQRDQLALLRCTAPPSRRAGSVPPVEMNAAMSRASKLARGAYSRSARRRREHNGIAAA